MTSDLTSPAFGGFAVTVNRVQPVVLALLVMLAAMLLPMAHTALQGPELLTTNFVATYASRGPMSPAFAAAARTAAETRIKLQPVIGPFQALALMLAMAGCAWLLARWRAIRISFSTALRAAVVAVAAGMLFYLVLYFAGWALLGSSRMLPEWQSVVPTNLGMLRFGPRAVRTILEGISVGALVRFGALGVALRKLVPTMPIGTVWIVVVGTATLTFAAFVLGSLL